nr:unnamed protein product [Digitaria exilis]
MTRDRADLDDVLGAVVATVRLGLPRVALRQTPRALPPRHRPLFTHLSPQERTRETRSPIDLASSTCALRANPGKRRRRLHLSSHWCFGGGVGSGGVLVISNPRCARLRSPVAPRNHGKRPSSRLVKAHLRI